MEIKEEERRGGGGQEGGRGSIESVIETIITIMALVREKTDDINNGAK